MANICTYQLKAVANDEDALREFLKVLNYESEIGFVPRVFSAEMSKRGIRKDEESGLYEMTVDGDTAWNCDHWFCTRDTSVELVKKDKDGNDYAVKGCFKTGIDDICKTLGVGVEIWSEEPGCCFQEHYIVDHGGCTLEADSVEWTAEGEDEDGEVTEEEGGFDDYLQYCYADEIYGEDCED